MIERSCRLLMLSGFFILMLLTGHAFAEKNTIIILDASGSMRSQIEGMSKMDIAKDVICDYVATLPKNTNVGLIVYGHRDKENCNDIEYLVKLGKNNSDILAQKVISVKPKGQTPIAASLDKAVQILDKTPGENTIILVSDGKESCSGEPCALMERQTAEGKNFICHVIGFDVDAQTKKELACIAIAGKGKYYAASDLEGLKIAFKKVSKIPPAVVTVPDAPVKKPVKPPVSTGSGILSLPKASYVAGERIWLHISTPAKYEPKAWVGIVPSNIPHGKESVNDEHDVAYKYLEGKETGDFEFFAPGKPGQYDFRLNDTDNNGVEVASVSFEVVPGIGTVSLSKTNVVCGETFNVSFSTQNNVCPKAWIGIVPSDVPHGSEDRNDQFDVAYHYIGDRSNGTMTFNAPSKPGQYDIRFNDTDDHGSEIASAPFTVSIGSADLHINKTAVHAGEKISVTFNTPSKLEPKAWIGIIPSDVPHGSEERNDQFDVAYQYLKGRQSGTLEFTAPTKPGSYDFRLNDTDNNGNELASVTFTVTEATGTGKGPITWDFENGTLDGWTATGTAFDHQPTYGDNPTARHRGQPSKHQGNYWIGGYENCHTPNDTPGTIQGDGPQGTLTSKSFVIKKPIIGFLIGGGCDINTVRAELVVDGVAVRKATGKCTETVIMEEWNVSEYIGKKAVIRLIDLSSGGWGHINFDDVRFY